MSYAVKEIFLTLQGEGGQAGRPAVFCRFAGCNLWSGREQDRADAVCSFCDTDFVGMDGPGGGRFATADDLARAVEAQWRGGVEARLVVLTGGEPPLLVDDGLIAALHGRGFTIAVETNGTLPAPAPRHQPAPAPPVTAQPSQIHHHRQAPRGREERAHEPASAQVPAGRVGDADPVVQHRPRFAGSPAATAASGHPSACWP